MSELKLITTTGEIKQRLSEPHNSLSILKIINYSKPSNWNFIISFDNKNVISLRISCDSGAEYEKYLNGIFPEIFRANKIFYTHHDKCICLDVNDALLMADESNAIPLTGDNNHSLSGYDFELVGVFNNILPPEFNDKHAITHFLLEHTWLGSDKFSNREYEIEIDVLARKYLIPSSSCIEDKINNSGDESFPKIKKVLPLAGGKLGDVTFFSSYGASTHEFRISQFGKIPNHACKDRFNIALKKFPLGSYEINSNLLQLGTDGNIMITEDSLSVFDALSECIINWKMSERYISYTESCAKFRKVLAANRIDDRKKKLLVSEFVYFNNVLVYKKPTNEMETIALHQKLEGMGGIPFFEFISLEYTAKLDIDSVAHYKVQQIDQLHKFATVEYEYLLSNYFKHDHPVEQTNVIVCWEVDVDQIPDGTLNTTTDPWLYHLSINNHKIIVAELINYPHLTILPDLNY